MEANLIDRIGDSGKKLHTGRSRNDQVALDMRLYTRSQVEHTKDLLHHLLETILSIMEDNTETIMPGFTHLQKAQPITLAHHMGAYFEMFKRDVLRLSDIYERMNYCPLGSGALQARHIHWIVIILQNCWDFTDRPSTVWMVSATGII